MGQTVVKFQHVLVSQIPFPDITTKEKKIYQYSTAMHRNPSYTQPLAPTPGFCPGPWFGFTAHYFHYGAVIHRRYPLDFQCNLLALDPPDDLLRRILGNDLIIMEHLKLLSGITAHEVEQRLRAAGVLVQPVG